MEWINHWNDTRPSLWWKVSQSGSPSPTAHIFHFDGMSVKRIHSPSNPPCLAPVSNHPVSLIHTLRPISRSIVHVHVGIGFTGDTSLPLWWYAGHSSSPATHIVRFDGLSATWIHSPSNPSRLATCLWPPVSIITHWSDTQVNIRRYPRAPNEGEHSNEQRATSSEPRAPERAYANHERLDTQSRLWVYD